MAESCNQRGVAAQGLQVPMDISRSANPLCRLDDVPEDSVLGLDPPDPEGDPLLLAREGERVRAWLNICPHAGRRMDYAPGLFLCKDGKLTCAVHGACFDLAQAGLCIGGPCRGESLTEVPVRVENGMVCRA